jgi:flagellar hook protein FlgE
MPLTSIYTALTGINNASTAMNVIGDNLANMNTTAFKSGSANFSELLAGLSGTSSTGDPISMGLGSTLSGVDNNWSQGTINSTGNSMDAAINGNGFFVVSTNGGMGFTRAGQFSFDQDGNLLSSDGFQLLGYPAVNGTIDTSGALQPINIKEGQIVPGTATTSLTVSANLDAQGSTFSSSVQVYDSLGKAHTVDLTFTKIGQDPATSNNEWSWSATIPATDTGGASTDPAVLVGSSLTSGELEFDGNGKLVVADPTAANPTLELPNGTTFADGANDMNVTFNLWDSQGNTFITNYASDSTVSSSSQNGFASSALTNISINSDGVIMGSTASGQSIPMAQLALADFPNVGGLEKYQGSTFVAFSSSGDPSIGIAGTGGRGTITGSSLEQSNVDMAQEFVDLIVAQRAYQANSRVISTWDQLVQDSLNLIR